MGLGIHQPRQQHSIFFTLCRAVNRLRCHPLALTIAARCAYRPLFPAQFAFIQRINRGFAVKSSDKEVLIAKSKTVTRPDAI
ncbi:hypothetical protein DSL62_11720 [Pantoea sp. 3_1284]|nr:hypothetical protein DSL62_11720 [Pantoea sp. 3_1284]